MNQHRLGTLLRSSAALLLVALAACKSMCSDGGACPPHLTQADKEAIAANSDAWLKAVRAQDWKTVAATYTQDAMLLPPNMPVVSGRDAIQAFFTQFPPIVSMEVADVEVDGCCTVAYVRGTYSMAIAPPGAGTLRETGKYIEIRRKEADGRWLKLRDMFSSDEPAAH
ncbi:MAG: SgcJ/EcaC family oxidoreductase [Planctomycetes bacterium]|nr:SgcJ/EcaC family oxidoreductase [Planctomycetota bacterium]